MKIIVFFIGLMSFCAFSQNESKLPNIESDLENLLNKLRNSKTDAERELHNLTFYETIKGALKEPDILTYEFSRLTTISTIKSPDGEFRLFNWNVENQQLSHSHYCLMVKKGKTFGANAIIEFKEDKITIPPNPSTLLTPQKWYGALYYKIIPLKKGNKTLYTVMGYNGNTRSSNKKILEVFWFKGNRLRLGYPLFEADETSTKLKRRIFFEYSEKAIVSVKFLEGIGKIVFDHLTPETENLTGMYEFYIPDMTYDAYYWKNGVWKYQKDIQVGNKIDKTTKKFYVDSETGEEKFRVEKNKWEDPTAGAPGEKHVAVEIENKDQKKTDSKSNRAKKPKKEKITKRKKSNPHSAIKVN